MKSRYWLIKFYSDDFQLKPYNVSIKNTMRSTDPSACTAEAANDVMDSFNFSSKAYLFDEVIPMPMKAEVTASCNPKLGDRLFSSKL